MDSEDESFDGDSGNVSSGEDDFVMDVDPQFGSSNKQQDSEDYPFEVLTTEQIVSHMTDCIKEVNSVVEVSSPKQPSKFNKTISLLIGNLLKNYYYTFRRKKDTKRNEIFISYELIFSLFLTS